MPPENDTPRNSSSQMLPLVLAAFAGATLAIACERPDARMANGEAATEASVQPRPAQPVQPPTPAPALPPRAQMPSPEATTDPAITKRVAAALAADPQMKGADISVNTDDGVVALTGVVKSHEQGAMASAHAQGQDGVMRVDNHLAVVME